MTSKKVVIITSIIFLCTITFWIIAYTDMNDFSLITRKNLNILGLCLPVVVLICFAILYASEEPSNCEKDVKDKQEIRED